jgi:hypothetical protein
MRPVSLGAVILSNLAQIGSVLTLIGLSALTTLGVAWVWAGFPSDIKPIAANLESSSVFISLIGAASVVPSSIMAGYVAGHMERRRPIIHGALSSCAWLLLLILVILLGSPAERHSDMPPGSGSFESSVLLTLFGMLISIGTPLLGAFGGAMASKVPLSILIDGLRKYQVASLIQTLGLKALSQK